MLKSTKERTKKQQQIVARSRKVTTAGSGKQTNAATADRRNGKANAVQLDAEPLASKSCRNAGKKAQVQPTASKKGLQGGSSGNRGSAAAAEVLMDRRTNAEHPSGGDRRKQSIPVAVERRKLERRAKVSRRRQIDPTTCERDYSTEEVEFMAALDAYKRSSGRMFPTCSEVLEVFRSLGYAKQVAEPAASAAPVFPPLAPTPSFTGPAPLAAPEIEPFLAMPVGA